MTTATATVNWWTGAVWITVVISGRFLWGSAGGLRRRLGFWWSMKTVKSWGRDESWSWSWCWSVWWRRSSPHHLPCLFGYPVAWAATSRVDLSWRLIALFTLCWAWSRRGSNSFSICGWFTWRASIIFSHKGSMRRRLRCFQQAFSRCRWVGWYRRFFILCFLIQFLIRFDIK
jgi:hypothetical protein